MRCGLFLQARLEAISAGFKSVAFSIITKQRDDHLPAILEVLKKAEELSK
jgi:hypothetical protein